MNDDNNNTPGSSSARTGLSPEQVSAFQRDGFLNAGRVLDDAELDELSAELDRIIAVGPDGFADGEPQPVVYRTFED